MLTAEQYVEFKPSLTLRECMNILDQSGLGYVIVVDHDLRALGTLTDGDIRRAMLKGASLDSNPAEYMQRNFTWVNESHRREQCLKLFESHVKFVPVLADGVLRRVITRHDVGYAEKTGVIVRAKAPARISFGGGGTDLTPFFMEHGGAVLNGTINMYSRATLKLRPDSKVKIVSRDFSIAVEADDYSQLSYDGKLDLIKAAVKLLKPTFGFELEISSDFPPGSGLGGSSVALAAVIGCFNETRTDTLDVYDIAELAFQAERIELSCSGGWQDQYATVFGGFNFMEFSASRNEINTLKIPAETAEELEERLILCYTGRAHPDRKIHDVQKTKMLSEATTTEFAKRTRAIAHEMKFHLLRGHLEDLAGLLHEGWQMKKTFSDGITDGDLDAMYDFARANGAAGGKLLGAGGGGYFLFQSHRDRRHELTQALKDKGWKVQGFNFDLQGLRSWNVK